MVTPGAPPPPEPQPHPQYVPKRRPGVAILVIGLIIGVVVGGGGIALILLTGSGPSSGPAADAAAVCGIVERTPDVPANPEEISLEYMQRWSISDVAASIAKTDTKYKPLADSLNAVLMSIRQLDLKEMRSSIQQARAACDQL